MENEVLEPAVHKSSSLHCSICGGSHLYRLQRKGIMERGVLSLLGYFPWKCSTCKGTLYMKQRYKKKRTRHAEAAEA